MAPHCLQGGFLCLAGGGGCGRALLLPAALLSPLNGLMQFAFQPGSATGTGSNEENLRGPMQWFMS